MISETAQYEDLKDLLVGEQLGVGIYRKVGVFLPDPTLVIKCAVDDPHQNILEWEIWDTVKDTPYAKWFAECVRISACGMFMLQRRLEHRPRSEYPKKIPTFFTDLKYKNFGWLNGQFKCLDYSGLMMLIQRQNGLNNRVKKADWWE